jgi:hypothetical protein
MNAVATRRPPSTQTRLSSTKIKSYDPGAHTVIFTLSVGAVVERAYGLEKLLTEPGAVDLDRVKAGICPLLDSHKIDGIINILGNVEDAWFEKGALVGKFSFDDSDAGRNAESMVARGAVKTCSIGYRVNEWEIVDDDGDVVTPNQLRWDSDDIYTFIAKRWTLLESSLVAIPADSDALVRSAFASTSTIDDPIVRAILARMRARHAIATRHR